MPVPVELGVLHGAGGHAQLLEPLVAIQEPVALGKIEAALHDLPHEGEGPGGDAGIGEVARVRGDGGIKAHPRLGAHGLIEGRIQQADQLPCGGAILDVVDLGEGRIGDVMIDAKAGLGPHPAPLAAGAARIGAVHGHIGFGIRSGTPRQDVSGVGQKGIEMGHGIVADDPGPLAQLR